MVFDVNTLYRLKGYFIRLKVENDEYEGVLLDVVTETSCVCLGKVHCLSDGTTFSYLKFYSYEIESWSVTGSPKEKTKGLKKSVSLPEEEGPRLVKLRPLPIHLKDKDHSYTADKNLLISGNFSKNSNDDEDDDYQVPDYAPEKEEEDTEKLPDLRFKLPQTTCIIDKINDNFCEIITYILNQHLVGICAEGVNIGRHGKICWISISTPKYICLFDICNLEKEAFDNGLKELFEKPTLLKICHDCRQLSDALFHQYGVKLANVFDTQVGDVFIYYKKNNRMPNHVRGLGQCLMEYLQLDPKHIHFQRVRENFEEEELTVWTLRPLPRVYEKAAIKHVIYLRDLRVAILEQLLSELNDGIDIYLNILRDCSEEELHLCPSVPHLLPPTFEMLQSKRNKKGFQHFLQSNNNGFSENVSQVQDPYIVVNKGIWHYKKNLEQNDSSNKFTSSDAKDLMRHKKSQLDGDDDGSRKLSENINVSFGEKHFHNGTNSHSNTTTNYKMIPKQYEEKTTAFMNHPKKRIDWPIKKKTNSSSEFISSSTDVPSLPIVKEMENK